MAGKISRLTLALILTIVPLTLSCSEKSPNTNLNSIYNEKLNIKINGKVEFPSFLPSHFSSKATIQEVASGATVSLIYPPDYSDVLLRNITISTGITDSSGKFKINPDSSFVPQTNSVLILEAIKRIGGQGNNIISLRTNIMWNGSGWDSITYPEILINAKTTSLSIISSLNSSSLPSKDTIKKMQVINGVSQVADINPSFTTYLINAIKGTVEQALTNNLDSVATISLNNNQYLFQGNPIPIPTPTPISVMTKDVLNHKIYFQSTYGTSFINENGTEQPTLTNSFSYSGNFPALSPDGTKIAYSKFVNSRYSIFTNNTNGGNEVEIVWSTHTTYLDLQWSPDGTKIAFNIFDNNDGTYRMFLINPDGSNLVQISNQSSFWGLSWSPDGSKIVFQGLLASLRTMDSDGSNPILRTSSNYKYPSWSPNGKQIAVVSNKDSNNEIYVFNLPDYNNAIRLTNSPENESYPSWSPDGTKIVFNRNTEIYTMNADGSNQTKLTNNPSSGRPRWGTPSNSISIGNRPVTTLAGSTRGFVDGTGTNAQFSSPKGLAVDSLGNVYVADAFNYKIRKITTTGVVSTLSPVGLGTNALFNLPSGIAVDSEGNLFVADSGNHKISKITSAGSVFPFAGSSTGTSGFADGTGTNAQFNNPLGVAVDSSGNVYVADTFNNKIRKITTTSTPAGNVYVVSTLAGSGVSGFADGLGTNAKFNYPKGVAVDSSGNVYVADFSNNRIRKITPAGVVSTFADTNAVYGPSGVAVDSSGNVYVADTFNNRVCKISNGLCFTIAGSTYGFADGAFNNPSEVAVDSSGNVFVSDSGNYRIRKIQ